MLKFAGQQERNYFKKFRDKQKSDNLLHETAKFGLILTRKEKTSNGLNWQEKNKKNLPKFV